jgi:hypothetical protein
MKKSFFAGQEEVFGRIGSLIFSLLLFTVYISASGGFSVNYQSLLIILLIFWGLYESLSLVLFQLFIYFSSSNTPQMDSLSQSESEKEITDIDKI